MAEVTAMRNNVLPYPIYSLPYTFVFPVLDADGDLVTGGTSDTPDSELSKNGDTFTDCTEAVEIATASGMYYISLTAAEMTCNVGALIFKTATAGTKTTPIVFYPRVLPVIRSATAQAGAVNSITLDASASAVDDYYNGCVVYISAGTGAGQVRTIYDYTGASKVALVSPNWTAPANDSTFYVYLTDNAWLNTGHLDAPISTVDTVVDGIQTDLSNGTDGLGALKALIDAITAAGPTKAEMDTAHALLATPAQVATALTNYDAPTKAEMDTAHALLATEAKQDIIDTVVDGIQTDLSNATDGLGALKTLIEAVPTASEIQTEMEENGASLLDTIRDELANGTDGLTALKALIDAAQGDITTIAGYTDILDHATNGLANIKSLIDAIDTVVDSILVDTGTTLPAQIAALNNVSAAEVNAEVLDCLVTDTHAELAAVPAATSSLKDKINWLFALARNKITQTATTQTLRNNADDGSIAASSVSDDSTTATRDKWS